MRWIKRLGIVVIFLAIPLVGVYFLIPAGKIAQIASREISAQTGRKVTFGGGISPSFYPVLGVKTGSLTIANASWGSDSPMLKAQSVLIGVEFLPLLSGIVKVKKFRLVNPEIRLERAADGRVNWAFGSSPTSPKTTMASAAAMPGFSFDDAQITGGKVSYTDRKTGAVWRVSGLDMDLRAPDATGPATLKGKVHYKGQEVSFQGYLKDFARFLGGGVSGISGKLTGDFGAVSVRGRAGFNPPLAELETTAETGDLGKAAALAGLSPKAFASFGRTAGFRGKIIYTKGQKVYVRNTNILLGANSLSGNLDLSLAGKPRLRANLTAANLDLAGLSASAGAAPTAASAKAVGAGGWSKARLDLGGLNLFDADVAFAANSINFGSGKIGPVKMRARLKGGRMVLDLTRGAAYGGTFGGQLRVNATKGLSISGNLGGKDLSLRPLLKDIAGYDRLASRASFRLKFKTSGHSINALMKQLSGSGRVDVGAGEIIGFDLLGMLQNLDTAYRGAGNKTIFSSITGSYTISKGILTNSDLAFKGPLVQASGSGSIDIGQREINYRITPVAFSSKQSGGLSVPVMISGNWSDIRFRPDLTALLGTNLQKDKKAVEAQLRLKVKNAQKRAADQLRGKVEKAIKGDLQKSLGNALKGLAGQN